MEKGRDPNQAITVTKGRIASLPLLEKNKNIVGKETPLIMSCPLQKEERLLWFSKNVTVDCLKRDINGAEKEQKVHAI